VLEFAQTRGSRTGCSAVQPPAADLETLGDRMDVRWREIVQFVQRYQSTHPSTLPRQINANELEFGLGLLSF